MAYDIWHMAYGIWHMASTRSNPVFRLTQTQPIMELKANERLSVRGYAQIKRFFSKFSSLWEICTPVNQTKVAKCFRCVVNGGRDPTVLRALQRDWQPEGMRLRITDQSFIQKVLRECGAIDIIVSQFLVVSETLNYGNSAPPTETKHLEEAFGAEPESKESEFDPEFYGVPKEWLMKRNTQVEAPVEVGEEGVAGVAESAGDGVGSGVEGVAVEPTGIPGSDVDVDVDVATSMDQPQPSPVEAPTEESTPAPDFGVTPAKLNMNPSRGGSLRGSFNTPPPSPAVMRDLSQMILSLCFELSIDPETATIMCAQGICDGAVVLIEKDFALNPRDIRIAHTLELMWNVLEPFIDQFKANNASPDEVRACLNQFSDQIVDFGKAVTVMKALILFTLNEGFRLADKELRNEVLIILTMLAQFPFAVGFFIECGLFHLLITYACIEEAGDITWDQFSTGIGSFRSFATVADVDLEFKKELWFVISELLRSNDLEALAIFSSSPLAGTLLLYMETESFDGNKKPDEMSMSMDAFTASMDDTLLSKAPSRSATPNIKGQRVGGDTHKHGTVGTMGTEKTGAHTHGKKTLMSQLPLSKLREFQLLAVTFLLHNAPRVLPAFEELEGPIRVISLTLRYCQSDVPDHKSLIFHSLMLLQKCLLQSPSLRRFMEDNNLIQSFLYVYHKSDHEETQAQSLRLIATLCSDDNLPLQALFSSLGGISDLVNLLSNYVSKRPPLAGTKAGIKLTLKGDAQLPDPYENPYGGELSVLVIAVLDCLMKAVVGNPISEETFADMEGVDVFLDLMESSHFVLRLQVLRFLSDILRNQRLKVFVNSWRSPKTLRSAVRILCHAWLDEDARVVGEKRPNGIIRDVDHPLGLSEIEELDPTPLPSSPTGSTASSSAGGYYAELANAPSSRTVSKLAAAILSSRNANQTNLPIDICTSALERDSRVVIASILDSLGVFDTFAHSVQGSMVDLALNEMTTEMDTGTHGTHGTLADENVWRGSNESMEGLPSSPGSPKQRVNFDETGDKLGETAPPKSASEKKAMKTANKISTDLGLTPMDRQVLSMAKHYAALRESEWWQAVRASAAELEVIPIESDLALIDARLLFSRDAATTVQLEQKELYIAEERLKKEEEDEFIDQIITKKNQQIKAEWLKKNGKLISRAPVVNKKK
jgi:hypothetical protein